MTACLVSMGRISVGHVASTTSITGLQDSNYSFWLCNNLPWLVNPVVSSLWRPVWCPWEGYRWYMLPVQRQSSVFSVVNILVKTTVLFCCCMPYSLLIFKYNGITFCNNLNNSFIETRFGRTEWSVACMLMYQLPLQQTRQYFDETHCQHISSY